MKHFKLSFYLFISLFLLINNAVDGQNNNKKFSSSSMQLLDKINGLNKIVQDRDSISFLSENQQYFYGVLAEYIKHIFDPETKLLQTTEHYYVYDNWVPVLNTVSKYHYNTFHKVDTIIQYNILTSGDARLGKRTTVDYNCSLLVNQLSEEIWDVDNNIWEKHFQYHYKYYSNLEVAEMNRFYGNENITEWAYQFTELYKYNELNNLARMDRMTIGLLDTVFINKFEREYDNNNFLKTIRTYKYTDMDWFEDNKLEFKNDEFGNPIHIDTHVNSNTGWSHEYRYEFAYNYDELFEDILFPSSEFPYLPEGMNNMQNTITSAKMYLPSGSDWELVSESKYIYGKMFNEALSINENNWNKTDYNLYPNPAKDIFYIRQNGNNKTNQLQVAIYNTLGVLVKRVSMDTDSQAIDISNLSSGLYTIVIKSDGNNTVSKKLIIK